ncbi:hypothetical protein Ancab_001282 [Ancistrocladus abbreviatus]
MESLESSYISSPEAAPKQSAAPNQSPDLVFEEEGSKRKRSLEDGGDDRFADEASMKDCFDESEPEPEPEPKPKPKPNLKLSAPKIKRTRRYVNPKLMQFNESVGRCSFCQEENIDHEGMVAEQ